MLEDLSFISDFCVPLNTLIWSCDVQSVGFNRQCGYYDFGKIAK